MTESYQSDLADLLRNILQQQAAMLQVHAESVRLQRVLVEGLLGASNDEAPVHSVVRNSAPASGSNAELPFAVADAPEPLPIPTASEPTTAVLPVEAEVENAIEAAPLETGPALPVGVPSPADQSVARGSRYYQPRPSPTTKLIAPEQLELMRRLQEMRDAGDLILQFGPHKGVTLAQVALSHPEYIRQLMTGAQRPEVRAAAGRLVEALDAAAEHKRRTPGSAGRRGRSNK